MNKTRFLVSIMLGYLLFVITFTGKFGWWGFLAYISIVLITAPMAYDLISSSILSFSSNINIIFQHKFKFGDKITWKGRRCIFLDEIGEGYVKIAPEDGIWRLREAHISELNAGWQK